jgi:hypothetical protein
VGSCGGADFFGRAELHSGSTRAASSARFYAFHENRCMYWFELIDDNSVLLDDTKRSLVDLDKYSPPGKPHMRRYITRSGRPI